MYAETDFLLALIKGDDWLSERAEEIYEDHGDDIWTSEHALLELMLVAYREDRDVLGTVANVDELVEVRGEKDRVITAPNYVENHGMTPFDAVHLVRSGDDPILSSDSTYDEHTERVELRPTDEEGTEGGDA